MPQEILGRERRRRWSDEDRARIVAESFEPGVPVSWVARRHDLSPSQLFAWRKAARPTHEAPALVEALIPVEVRPAGRVAQSDGRGEPARAQIAFPNGRHLFVSTDVDRRLLDALIAAVAAS